jgi:ABC-type multidrug transport system fused ATPase/permease subunit
MEAFFYYIKRFNTFSGRVLYWNILGMGFTSFFEGLSILLLVPMLSISGIGNFNNGESFISDFLEFIDVFPKTLGLPLILVIYVLLITSQNLLDKNLTIRNVKISQSFIGHLRKETYRDLLHVNWGFYTRRRKSDLINIMTIELARVAGGINQYIQLLTSLVFTIIQIVIAFWLSAQMTVFVLVSGLALAFFSRKFIKQSKALGSKTSVIAQEYLAGITDQLNGIKDIKSNTLEESRLNWLQNIVRGMFDEQIEYIRLRTTSQVFYKIASTILIAIFILLSVKMFKAQPEQFLLILVIFSRLWPRITSIQYSLQQLAATIPACSSLLDLQKECMEAIEIEKHKIHKKVKPLLIKKEVECQNIYFRYDKNEPNFAVQAINITIKANQMTAIIGKSGAGKSTLIDILMGLNQPEVGNVVIDGVPLTSENLLSWRKSISYVSQDPFLFNESIRANFEMIDPNVTNEQIWEALQFAAAADFVKSLPDGLDTLMGDRGIRLSGGERQRLVLARAIIKKPSVLILDEATSALDLVNERKIQDALDMIKEKMTIVIIAHRLSTIRNADQVIVLDQGIVIEKGRYTQLVLDKRGVFSNLIEKQREAIL